MIDFKKQKQKKKDFHTKSTTASLKFANQNKVMEVKNIINEYKNVMQQIIDNLWTDEIKLDEKIPTFVSKEHTKNIDTWLSARLVQSAGKQALGIIKGTRNKQKKRLYKLNEFNELGHYKKARKLQKVIDKAKISKPIIKNVKMELDSKCVKIDFNENTSFEGWITLTSIGNKIKLHIPFNKHKHFNKLLNKGTIKNGVRLSEKDITFMFDVPRPPKKEQGETLGIDIGSNTLLACSNDEMSHKDIHGWDMDNISDRLSVRKKGSKGFQRAQEHRENHIHWAINQINFELYNMLKLEDIKYLRYKQRTSRKLSHWAYTIMYCKLEDRCLEQGVLVKKMSPTYTSKRCSVCGWTRVGNRRRGMFKCRSCGFTCDPDLNAARNISATIEPIKFSERHKFDVKNGFYWH